MRASVCVCVCVRSAGSIPPGHLRHCDVLKVSPWGCPRTNSNYHQITEIMGDPAVRNLTLSDSFSPALSPPYGHFTAQQSLGSHGER